MSNKIIHARSDFMFKKLFADPTDKTNLRRFLGVVLSDIPESEFEDLAFKETELLSDFKEGRTCILDLLAVTKSGYEIHAEIQVVKSQSFIKRMVYYNAKLVASQLASGSEYEKLERSVSIFILDFKLIDDDKYFHSFRFYDKKNDKELTELTEIITIELPKVAKDADGTELWYWVMLFKADTEEDLEMLESNAELSGAVATIRRFSKDREAWLQFEAEEKARADYRVHMAESKAEGRAEGRAEGIAEGIAEGELKGKLDVARAMFANGLTIEMIAQYTGLSFEDLEKLK